MPQWKLGVFFFNMALKDQPYIPLYIQDVLTDEKLIECSAQAHGVYFRLICILHKQPEYGVILLKQKYKQTESTYRNFALMLARQLPFDVALIESALKELSDENVIQMSAEKLSQKRMVADCKLSETRAKAGSKGGKKSRLSNKNFATAKIQANSEYEYEYENEVVNKDVSSKGGLGENESIGIWDGIQLPESLNGKTEQFKQAWQDWEDNLYTNHKFQYANYRVRQKAIEDIVRQCDGDLDKTLESVSQAAKMPYKQIYPADSKQGTGKKTLQDRINELK